MDKRQSAADPMDKGTKANLLPSARPAGVEVDMVRVIKRSLLSYNLSWLGLIPLLGIAPAIIALRMYWRTRQEMGAEWNPARKYSRMGMAVACCGLVISLVMWIFVFCGVWRGLNG